MHKNVFHSLCFCAVCDVSNYKLEGQTIQNRKRQRSYKTNIKLLPANPGLA